MALPSDFSPHAPAGVAPEPAEAALERIYGPLADPLICVRGDGRVAYLNSEALKMLGGEAVEYVNESIEEIDPTLYADAWRGHWSKVEDAGALHTYAVFRRKNGEMFPVDLSASHINIGGETYYCALARDGTELEQATLQLFESEERFRSAFGTASVGKSIVNREGRYVEVNPAFCRMLGHVEEELVGTDFRDYLHPEDAKDAVIPLRQFLRREIRSHRAERRFIRKDGEVAWAILSVVAVTDRLERVKYFIVEAEHVTEQRKTQEQLERANAALKSRNRELQEFAYVASHDLQEPLRKIRSFANLLATEYAGMLDANAAFYVDRVEDAARRMARLITDLLTFSRITTQTGGFEKVDLNVVIDQVLSDLALQITELHGTVEVGELPAIEGDETQMRQVLQNLVSNALKFHRPGTAPRVEVQAPEPVTQANGSPATCRINVRDNGIGFEEKYMDRIFTPFQRLHGRSAFEGTGMGLAICRRIVERHGGRITAESTPGAGAVFTLSLPLYQPR